MSKRGKTTLYAPRPLQAISVHAERVLLVVLLVAGAAFYLQGMFRFFMYDDEGGYLYAAWRTSLGEVPYRDFLTPQMPGFLYWGSLLIRLFGRSYAALRLPSLLATLLSAILLYAINRRLFNRAVGLASMGFFLVETNVFHNARFYRPEAYMLLFTLAGMYCLVLSEERQRLWYLWFAGLCFALSTTFKLFGFLPLAGCGLYLLYVGWRERRPLKRVALQVLALGLPALLLQAAVSLLFMRLTPYYFSAVLEHHTMQGAGMPLLKRFSKGLWFLKEYVRLRPVYALFILLGAVCLHRRKPLASLMAWQLPTVLSFLVLTRSLMTRHVTYLAPAMSTLVALAVMALVQGRWPLWRLSKQWHYQLLALALVLEALRPGALLAALDSNQADIEPLRLAALIQELTSPDDVVMSDFPGVNFASGRRSTYWAAGLSGGATKSGQILGAKLSEEIERENVAMVLINTRFGAHQMIELLDYADFRRYVQAHFALVDKYPCTYHQLEIYNRVDTMPLRPDINFQDQVALTGVRLSSTSVQSGSALAIDTRWQALGQVLHNYHVSLRLVDATGRVWAQFDESLAEVFTHKESGVAWDVTDVYRTTAWSPQQVVLQEHKLPIDAAVPSGSYYLVAQVYDLQSGYTLVGRGGKGLRLPDGDTVIATVRVASPPGVPGSDALPVDLPLRATLAEGLELVGVGRLPQSGRAGRELALELFWKSSGRPTQDYGLEFQLVQGESVHERWSADVVAGFATSTWQEGGVLMGHYVLPLPAELPGGPYDLVLQLLDSQGRALSETVRLATGLEINPKPDAARLRQGITHPLDGISFGEGIGLLGYDLQALETSPEGTIGLTLYWACLEAPERDYKVFTHLLDDAHEIQGQKDAIPDDGAWPTSAWVPGDLVIDHYEIPVAATAAPGTLRIEIGFYDPLTNQRLPVMRGGRTTGEDHLLIPDTVIVR